MMLDVLPRYVKCGKHRYKLYADYRRVLLLLEISRDERLTPDARTTLELCCVFRHFPASRKARRELLGETLGVLFPTRKNGNNERLTDIDQDADLIRCAFRQTYGIDLRKERLHWLEFSELLANIPEGTRYSEVIGIRAMPVPKASKYNAEYRNSVIKAKNNFALSVADDREIERKYRACVRSVAADLKAWAANQKR